MRRETNLRSKNSLIQIAILIHIKRLNHQHHSHSKNMISHLLKLYVVALGCESVFSWVQWEMFLLTILSTSSDPISFNISDQEELHSYREFFFLFNYNYRY